MKIRFSTAAIALTLALAGCGDDDAASTAAVNDSAPLPQVAAPNGGDWTQIVSETPEGGFRMGNPDAPVKLIEYASITCHVCAEFAEAGGQELTDTYVRSGQVSWEYRPFMLFPSDPGIFQLLRCQGPTPFFHLAEQLYATQTEWAGRLQSLPPEQMQQLDSMAPAERSALLVRAAGLDQFFRQRGMPDARINACLADQSQLERLADLTRRGSEQDNVSGTPTFFLNGERVDATQWNQVEPRLRAAIGG